MGGIDFSLSTCNFCHGQFKPVPQIKRGDGVINVIASFFLGRTSSGYEKMDENP
jgi:hypothetical protein